MARSAEVISESEGGRSSALDTAFFRDLTAVNDFSQLLSPDAYRPVPDSWFILMADIVDSTGAVQDNRYQDVNTLGASCIIAVLNACDADLHGAASGASPTANSRAHIPYIFGGDGATFAVPPACLDAALIALKGTQQVSETAYGLKLRTGYISVRRLRHEGFELLLSKMQVSEHAFQAAFAGGGISEAERRLKQQPEDYALPDHLPAEADFTGLQCRWDRIPSPQEETVSLLIESNCPDIDSQSRLYREALDRITEIYGRRDQHHPLRPELMQMTFDRRRMRSEARLYSSGKNRLYYWLHLLKMRAVALMGTVMMQFGMVVSGYNWSGYKADMIRHSDHRKFDNMLRMVMSGTAEQRRKLEQWLQSQQAAGVLNYGISTSEAALMTCLVFQHGTDHFHFVDGADGGYALAASRLKQQKKTPPPSETSSN